MEKKPSIFRKEALEYHLSGQLQDGDVLRIAPGWTRRAYWALVSMLVMAVVFCLFGRVREYAAGPAVVRLEGKTDLTVDMAGVVRTVEVQPGQRVEAGQVLVTFLSDEESSAFGRIDREFELQLVRFLRDPSDAAARQALTALRAERELAQARLERRVLRAPFDGLVGDVRIQPGQYLPAGTVAVSLMGREARASLIALLPGYYRPFLKPGMPLRVELDGFRYDYREFAIESVGEQVVGPGEVRRYLGAELGDALTVEGPIVMVKARLPATTFVSGGQVLSYFEGMPARVEAAVRAEPIFLTLLPGMKEFLPHGG